MRSFRPRYGRASRTWACPVQASVQSPWQNGIAERWIGTCRREPLDHVIVLNEQHLRRLLRAFLDYYHTDRTHLELGKDPPTPRPVCGPTSPRATVPSLPRAAACTIATSGGEPPERCVRSFGEAQAAVGPFDPRLHRENSASKDRILRDRGGSTTWFQGRNGHCKLNMVFDSRPMLR